jgi:hypothetical protein
MGEVRLFSASVDGFVAKTRLMSDALPPRDPQAIRGEE